MSASGWRKSTEKKTRPGITLRELGLTSSMPTVARASGVASPRRTVSATMVDAAASASRRRSIGVVPACDSMPATSISYQRMPCTPCTTPMVLPSASRIGPCSMWVSKNAATSRPPHAMSPA